MNLQANLNQSYFKQIKLDEVLKLAIDDFSANQIKCYALQVSDQKNPLETVRDRAIVAGWIKKESMED